MDKKQNWNINHSWSQPYLPTSYNPFYERARDLRLEEEVDRLEMVDRWVDSMLTYPDAEAIMNKIKKETGND
jgi:hypothetical protein